MQTGATGKENMPAAQVTQAETPCLEYWPAVHAVHVDAAEAEYVPPSHAVHLDALMWAEYMPAAHVVQEDAPGAHFSHKLCLVGSLFVPASTQRQQ